MEKINFTTSKNVSEVEYDAESKELFVTFKSGKKYKYSDVPADIYEQCKNPSPEFSIGKFINANVARSFEYEEVLD